MSATRRPIVSGNWKMNLDHFEAIHAARSLGLRLTPRAAAAVDVTIHPPFTDLRSVQTVVEAEGIPVSLGAQNCAIEDAGAFTGEVSPRMLARLHVTSVIVGHSERRRLFGETDELVAAKASAVVRNGMIPVCCVGETEEEREAGAARDRLAAQLAPITSALGPAVTGTVVIAYEPVWAIGTGRAATPDDAQEACRWIRDLVRTASGDQAADTVRIQYGGSVSPANTSSLMAGEDVDGLLVGGASLDAAAFVDIVTAAA